MRRHTYVFIAVLVAAFQFSQANAQIKRIGALYVEGKITLDGRKTGNILINLYQENEQIASMQSDKDGYYKLRLDFNHSFVVEFAHPEAITKRIYFDTSMEKPSMNVPEYEMYIDLLPQDYLKGVNIGELEFPMAIIKYNKEELVYKHVPKYTYHMEYVVNKLLAEAAIKQELEEFNQQN